MKLSAQEEYGIRCLLQVARSEPQSVKARAIAAAEGLSEANVAKLLRALRLANLLESTRGQDGGYRLTRPAAEIRLSEVVRALGGEFYREDFCEKFAGDRSVCVHSCECSLRSLWQGIGGLIEALLERCTLSDLLTPEVDMRTWLSSQLSQIAQLQTLA